jgi:hypothetical protein
MNKLKFYILCLFLLSACSSINDTNLHIFVLGRWKGEFPQEVDNPTTLTTYDVEFLPFNILLVDISGPEESVHGLRFSYKFITDDRIRIEGRIVNEIQVKNDCQNFVVVESDHGLPPGGRYERVFSRLEWLLVFVIFLLALISLVRYKLISKHKSTTIQPMPKQPSASH